MQTALLLTFFSVLASAVALWLCNGFPLIGRDAKGDEHIDRCIIGIIASVTTVFPAWYYAVYWTLMRSL